jgi:hypothetical protein
MNWLRNTCHHKTYEPPYYLIDNQPRARRVSVAYLAKAVGAILTLLTLVTGMSAIYETQQSNIAEPQSRRDLERLFSEGRKFWQRDRA